ncbi:MAG: histidine kinase [Saprospiraceae bacterium]
MLNQPAHTLNDKYLRLFGIPLSVLGFTLSQMAVFFPGRWDLWWKYALISLVFTALVWEFSRIVILRTRRRFPDLPQTKKRILWMLFLIILFMGVWQAINAWAIVAIGLASVAGVTFFQIWLTDYLCSFFVIAIICGAYEAIYFFGQYKNALQKAESLKKQQAQQRLDVLKTRVNPHFLFNSLTTLSALIGEDAPKAEHFVDELSKVYRYLLRAARQPTLSLGEELQFAESYAFLLKNRFEDGAFSLLCQPPHSLASLDQNVPALSLQNTIDYLMRTQNLPLTIELQVLERYLQITCGHLPKTISFNAPDHDWGQLEAHGAKQEIQSQQLKIQIPFTSNSPDL